MKDSLKKSPQTLQSIIGKIIEEKGWDDQLAFSKLEEKWESILGEKISQAVRLKSLTRGRLTLTTDSSTWRAEMLLRKDDLMAQINSLLNKDLVSEIVIR